MSDRARLGSSAIPKGINTFFTESDWICALEKEQKYVEAEQIHRSILAKRRDILGPDHPDTLGNMSKLAYNLRCQCRFVDAEATDRDVLDGRMRVLGPDHPDTLASMHSLAIDLRSLGKYSEAEKVDRSAIDGRKRVLGENHSYTLTSMHNFAITLRSLHKYGEAEDMDRATLEGRRRVLGPDCPATLWTMNNLAIDVYHQQRYIEAEDINRSVLHRRKRVLGVNHPDTLTSMFNLAIDLRSQGDYQEAEEMDRAALEGRARILGASHLVTLDSMHNLALDLRCRHKYKEAEGLDRAVLDTRSKVLGTDHANTLYSSNNLALDLYFQQKYGEAEVLDRITSERRRAVLGPDHADTLSSMHNLAINLRFQQKYSEAEEVDRSVLEARERSLGQDDLTTLTSMHNLALDIGPQRKYSESEKLNRAVLEGRRKVLGPRHYITLGSMHNLAIDLRFQQKHCEAEEMDRATLCQRRKVLGGNNVDTLWSMNNLAMDLYGQRRYSEAEDMNRATYHRRQKVLGPDHPDTLRSLFHLATDLRSQRKYKEAEELDRLVVDSRTRTLGAEHPDTLASMHSLASDLRLQKKYAESEEIVRPAMGGRKHVLGPDHLDTLASMHDLAINVYYRQRYPEAEKINRVVLNGRRKILGTHHLATLRSMHNLAIDLRVQQKYRESEEMDREAVDGRQKVLGFDHPATLASMHNLALDLRIQQKYREAEDVDRAIYQTRTKILGSYHPITLIAMHYLALDLKCQLRYLEAAEMDHTALQVIKSGVGHGIVIPQPVLLNAALVYRRSGLYEAAEMYDRLVLKNALAFSMYNGNEVLILRAMDNLLYDLYQQEKFDEAEALCHEVLKRSQTTGVTSYPIGVLSSMRILADIFLRRGEYAAAQVIYTQLLADSKAVHLRTFIAYDYGDLLQALFVTTNDRSYLDEAIDAFALSWENLPRDSERRHDPSSAFHKTMQCWFGLLHQLSSEVDYCPTREMFEDHINSASVEQPTTFEAFTSHRHLFTSEQQLMTDNSVDYLTAEIEGDIALLRVCYETSVVSREFRDDIARWTNVCHTKLPHLYKFGTTSSESNASIFLAFLCPSPEGFRLDPESTLHEVFETMELLAREHHTLYVNGEDRQLVLLSTLARCGNGLSHVLSARCELAMALLSNPNVDILQLGSLSEPKRRTLLDILQSFLDDRSQATSRRLISRAFQILKGLSRHSYSLPEILRIPLHNLTDISHHPTAAGGNSSVYRALYRGRAVALKVLRTKREALNVQLHSSLAREALIWRYLNHPHLLPFVGHCPEYGACLVTEWMSNGNLASFVLDHCDCDRRQLCMQSARGMAYLHHTAGVIHGDLRADNILVDRQCNVRITDFGLSALIVNVEHEEWGQVRKSSPASTQEYGGAARWFAPEYLKSQAKHVPGDVYAWACVLLEVFTQEQPFPWCATESQALIALNDGHKPWKLDGNSSEMIQAKARGLCSDATLFVERCWAMDPLSRPDMLTICQQLGSTWNLKWDDPYLFSST